MTENVLLAQLVNNFPPFLGNRSYIESYINLVETRTKYFFNIYSNIFCA